MVSSVVAYLSFLALLATERFVELAISRRNARAAVAAGARESGQRHYRVMAAFHALFLVSCAVEVIALRRPFPGALGFAALAGAVGAQGLRYWAIATLGRRWNVRIITFPDAAPVTGGPYRYIRHPNYLAVALEMICVPLVHGCWWTAIAFSAGNALLLRVRIRAEERALGTQYAAAFSNRPRFIPRLNRGA